MAVLLRDERQASNGEFQRIVTGETIAAAAASVRVCGAHGARMRTLVPACSAFAAALRLTSGLSEASALLVVVMPMFVARVATVSHVSVVRSQSNSPFEMRTDALRNITLVLV